MQGQTHVSSLLSLKSGNSAAHPERGRTPSAASNNETFSKLLERPSSQQANRNAQAQLESNGAARRQSESRNAAADRSRQDSAASHRPEQRRAEPARSEASRPPAPETTLSEQKRLNSHNAPAGSASLEGDPLEGVLASDDIKAQLAGLSDEDLALLGEKVAALLSQLHAQLEAGDLDPQTEEALSQLLLALEEGAGLDDIAQLLEALPIDVLPPGAGLADSDASNLRQLLGRSGAAYLAQLGREFQSAGVRLSGGEPAPALSSLANILESNQGADLDKLLTPGRELTSSASKDQFAQMLQTLSERGGTGARPTDLGQVGTQLASPVGQEARAPAPLQPSERQFMVQSEVRVPVNQGQWGQAVGQRVLWLAAQNVSSAELRLDPPDLGPMQVKVSSHQDQISVTFTSPQVAVREALDQSATRLREMFAEQGLDLVDVNVSDQSGDEQMAGDEQGQGTDSRSEPEDEPPAERILSSGLVDHYA